MQGFVFCSWVVAIFLFRDVFVQFVIHPRDPLRMKFYSVAHSKRSRAKLWGKYGELFDLFLLWAGRRTASLKNRKIKHTGSFSLWISVKSSGRGWSLLCCWHQHFFRWCGLDFSQNGKVSLELALDSGKCIWILCNLTGEIEDLSEDIRQLWGWASCQRLLYFSK